MRRTPQCACSPYRPWLDQEAGDYWKLSRAEYCGNCLQFRSDFHTMQSLEDGLREQKCQFPASANKARLVELLHRAERGLLSYDMCTEKELATFIRSRKLTGVTHKKAAGKERMMQILEKADDEATFYNFTALPPEIRLVVYGWNFASFGPAPVSPAQPPITRVDRLTRKEALPQFYPEVRFLLAIDDWDDFTDYTHISRAFLQHAQEYDHLAHIRHFRLGFADVDFRASSPHLDVDIMSGRVKEFRDGTETDESEQSIAAGMVRKIIGGWSTTLETRKLCYEDFLEILGIFES